MKIGIFDSGLGGLMIARSLISKLPQYDYVYLGDTKRVPYGDRSQKAIYEFTRQGLEFLFAHGCGLVIVACNTASAQALRKIQQEYLPRKHTGKKVLGVIIPTAEACAKYKSVGILATASTVSSGSYPAELKKLNTKIKIIQQAAPLLVPLIENNELKNAQPILREYLKPLLAARVQAIILACTHYPILKRQIAALAGKRVKIISQTEIIPGKLRDYLRRHNEINAKLSKRRSRKFYVTDLTPGFSHLAGVMFDGKIKLEPAKLS
ncbi:glutamate racemase [Patescibacteria group bacterium]|nr:glutamate racemase [Patescibacteria group bacterium]